MQEDSDNQPRLEKIETFENKIKLLENNVSVIAVVAPVSIWFKGNDYGLTLETKYTAIIQEEEEEQQFIWEKNSDTGILMEEAA